MRQAQRHILQSTLFAGMFASPIGEIPLGEFTSEVLDTSGSHSSDTSPSAGGEVNELRTEQLAFSKEEAVEQAYARKLI